MSASPPQSPVRPNLLFLMVDQCRADLLDPAHRCAVPALRKLAARGVRFERAYTPNAVCSPARASLMTGALPSRHGVHHVTHNLSPDQGRLREHLPHWAHALQAEGYRTGYFGKWHVEHREAPRDFGWDEAVTTHDTRFQSRLAAGGGPLEPLPPCRRLVSPTGYEPVWWYGVHDRPPADTPGGVICRFADSFLRSRLGEPGPWACFVSLPEPHDPFFCHRDFLALHPPDSITLPSSLDDTMKDKPNLYQRFRDSLTGHNEQAHREAAACYYGSLEQIDQLLGSLLDLVESAGQLDNTVVVFTSDHGELLGAHGLYCKNIGAFEDVYRIPLVMAGPGVSRRGVSTARVGLHAVGATLLELMGAAPLPRHASDGASFARTLWNEAADHAHTSGFAEYFGGRFILTQRIHWQDDWKLVFNGFDHDELYDLATDPFERTNLVRHPEHQDRYRRLMQALWEQVRAAEDESLLQTNYPPFRLGVVGPNASS